jgi:hypothetical protein
VTVAGASDANLKVGALTPAISGVSIGSEQHFNDNLAIEVAADIKTTYDFYKAKLTGGQIYRDLAPVATSPNFAGDIAGLRFTPGVYFASAAVTNSINVTFDALGDPGAEFVIQLGAAFAPAAGSSVTLLNGALAANIFWVVTGAVTCGAGSDTKGSIITPAAIGCGAGAILEGRLLAYGAGAVTMSANIITTT